MTTFGLHLTTYGGTFPEDGGVREELRAIGAAMDASDVLSTLWLTDHVQHLGPEGPTHPMPESYLALAAVAATTSRVWLGVLATSVVYRNPALLAKMITTLDVLSGGRAILGIGAGHPRTEAEARSYGYDFPAVGARMAMLDVALEKIRPMIGRGDIGGAPPNWPRPVQPGGIPILVAGSGEQKLLRIAARHADMINLSFPSGDTLDRIPHKRDVLATHCATVGRDASSIAVTYKAVLAVRRRGGDARGAWDDWRRRRGIGQTDHRAGVFVGTPDEVRVQIRPFINAGIDHLIVELVDAGNPNSIELAAETLAPLVTAPNSPSPAGVSAGVGHLAGVGRGAHTSRIP